MNNLGRATRLHTLYRTPTPGTGNHTVATIERYSGPRTNPYLLTLIANRVTWSSDWYLAEQDALDAARELGYSEGK